MQKIRQVGAELLQGTVSFFAILGRRLESVLITGILHFPFILCFVTNIHVIIAIFFLRQLYSCVLCVCVCVSVCMCTYIHTYIYTYIHTYGCIIQSRKRKIRDCILTSFLAFTINRAITEQIGQIFRSAHIF